MCFFNLPLAYGQEEDADKDKITDLPPVKIEIVDTTQINIPREKFRSFTKPESRIYTPLSEKERPWYLPDTSIPNKLKEKTPVAGRDSLLLLSSQAGAPVAFSYQLLLVKGFGSSEVLVDLGRTTLKTGRTPDKQEDSNTDKLKGAFAHQSENLSLRTDIQYNARDDDFIGENMELWKSSSKFDKTFSKSFNNKFTNDRALVDLSANLDLKISEKTFSTLSFDLSNLRMEGPLSSGQEKGLELGTDFKVKTSWPETNPIEVGLGVNHFTGSSDIDEFKETILRLHLRDNYVKVWSLVLGIGAELMLDVYKSPDDGWKIEPYPNPYLLLTSRIGNRVILQLGVERYILRQNLKGLYLDEEYIRYNPSLNPERTWDLNASLRYRPTGAFAGIVKVFDKEIRNLTVFEESRDEILSWEPGSRDGTRILGLASEWELILMDGKLKNYFQYIHESHEVKIPYRPKDRGSINVTYFMPFDLEPSLTVVFYSRRYADDNDPLSSYVLWKPKVYKSFGKYASVFLSAELYTGKDKYQLWKGYELPEQTVELGIKLKF